MAPPLPVRDRVLARGWPDVRNIHARVEMASVLLRKVLALCATTRKRTAARMSVPLIPAAVPYRWLQP